MSQRRRKQKWRLLLIFIGFGIASTAVGQEVLEEIIEQTYSLQPNAKFSLKNDDGSVRIYGADISEMKLQAIKKAYSKDRLDKIVVNVAVRPDLVSIDTSYPPKPKWGLSDRSGTVDYIVILPWFCDVQRVELGSGELLIEGMRGNEVHARLGSGRLFGHNCFTDMHLALGIGGLDVSYDWWETHSIVLHTEASEGNTRVFIPGDARFRLHGEAANGTVVTDFANDRRTDDRSRLDLAIGNEPNAEMNVRAVNGSIKIIKIKP